MNEKDGAVTVDIAVKPRSSREGVGPIQGDRLCVAVNAPPVDGKANEAVVRVLAGTFKVAALCGDHRARRDRAQEDRAHRGPQCGGT
jgi:uncharacterized protein (TIGR00251 family)